MFTDSEFKKYVIFTHKLSLDAQQYISFVRCSEPSRMVGTHATSNICSWTVSKKMGHAISTESRSAEKAFVILSECDKNIIEIWEQTSPVKIERTNKNAMKRAGSYTPDFLILTNEGPEIIEVKTESGVEKLLSKNHADWRREENGEITYIPAKEYFDTLGITFKVFVYKRKMRYLIANLELILLSRNKFQESMLNLVDLRKAFNESFVWSLYDLRKRLGIDSYTPIVRLIDKNQLFFEMNDELISLPRGCNLTQSKKLLKHAKSQSKIRKPFLDNMKRHIHISKSPSHREAVIALRKLEELKQGKTSRNLRRAKAAIISGNKAGISQFESLIPKYYLSGNRTCKINPLVENFLMSFLNKVHPKKKGISVYRSYIAYKVEANIRHANYDPVSRNTFSKRLNQIPEKIIAFERGGKRAGNAVSEPTDPINRALVPQLAWQCASIDHYYADIYLIGITSFGIAYCERPWITGIIDRATSAILAITLSFAQPSRKTDAKVLRECVRRHGKLPSEIIVDRGSDFTSTYFASLLAHYSITYTLRAAAHSRYGGEIEGFFGAFKKEWLTQREGNLADYKEARAVDGKKSPKKSAVLRPYDFYKELLAYCSWRESKCQGDKVISLRDKLEDDQIKFPFTGIKIDYDEEFLLATSVETREYTVNFQKGIHIGVYHYWHPDICKIRGKKKFLEVRPDPENPHIVYALIEDNWVVCANTKYNFYSAQDSITQFEEGLLTLETGKMKMLAKVEADENLYRIIKKMDKQAKRGHKLSSIAINKPIGSKTGSNIFEELKNSVVEPIHLEYWSE